VSRKFIGGRCNVFVARAHKREELAVASLIWSTEAHTGRPVMTVQLDKPYYGDLLGVTGTTAPTTAIGTTATITFCPGCDIQPNVQAVLNRLRDAIIGSLYDDRTGASV
jgi:hypothetical protein